MKQTADTLCAALKLLDGGEAWLHDGRGVELAPDGGQACKFCVSQAIDFQIGELAGDRPPEDDFFFLRHSRAMDAIRRSTGVRSIVLWNDRQGRTWVKVEAAFLRAIAAEEADVS